MLLLSPSDRLALGQICRVPACVNMHVNGHYNPSPQMSRVQANRPRLLDTIVCLQNASSALQVPQNVSVQVAGLQCIFDSSSFFEE